ncbi:MAG: cytochrome c3 family protein [Reichenbachiella sp.]|uniref:cytochrome c3 family protein n=1 Tax=Reichenbachiella sp. TaxID=2184521 RepID=UPI003266AAE4
MKNRFVIISLCIALMISAIVIIDISLESGREEANLHFEPEEYSPSLPTESGVFRRSEFALDYENMPGNESRARKLADYYMNRAYLGAPPTIPHALLSETGIGGNSCLQCHENGGYVDQFKAYAPVTPHPEMMNCRQCHVAPKTKSLFKRINWEKISHPSIKGSALEGSPPVIPHTLQMRENCLACHAGPAAPKEIKVTHALRINCRQCHVPVQEFSTMRLKWDSTDQFFRKPK